MRTQKEIDAIIAFWWQLQEHRADFLRRKGRADTPEVVLNESEIGEVKRRLENKEFWFELEPWQKKTRLSFTECLQRNSS